MKYFKKIDLPSYDILLTFNEMLENNAITWQTHTKGDTQICVNTVPGHDDPHYGVGSLYYDVSTSSNNQLIRVVRDPILTESDFSELCSVFKDTIIEEMYNELKKHYRIGRVRFMRSFPKTCLTWHTDTSTRLHYPLLTHEGCFMVIEDEVMHIPQNEWWETNTLKPHTAFNGSTEERLHLVASIL